VIRKQNKTYVFSKNAAAADVVPEQQAESGDMVKN